MFRVFRVDRVCRGFAGFKGIDRAKLHLPQTLHIKP